MRNISVGTNRIRRYDCLSGETTPPYKVFLGSRVWATATRQNGDGRDNNEQHRQCFLHGIILLSRVICQKGFYFLTHIHFVKMSIYYQFLTICQLPNFGPKNEGLSKKVIKKSCLTRDFCLAIVEIFHHIIKFFV